MLAPPTALDAPAQRPKGSEMPRLPSNPLASDERQAIESLSKMWWLWLVMGVIWTVAAVVILQFDQASVTTVGVIIGIMFLGAAAQNLTLAMLADRGKWLFGIFGGLFLVAAVLAFISPENTFAAIADMLGFLFLLVGVFWIIEAFSARAVNDLWWLGLLSGILMVMLAFYTGGQFFVEKAYVLLVFAGIWALLTGLTDIVRAFQLRQIGRLI
jgi:uncharacterized membrane protein HdeD (DUF308 family)